MPNYNKQVSRLVEWNEDQRQLYVWYFKQSTTSRVGVVIAPSMSEAAALVKDAYPLEKVVECTQGEELLAERDED